MKHEMKSKLSCEVCRNLAEAFTTPSEPLIPREAYTKLDDVPEHKIPYKAHMPQVSPPPMHGGTWNSHQDCYSWRAPGDRGI